jgi:hypothetical protein
MAEGPCLSRERIPARPVAAPPEAFRMDSFRWRTQASTIGIRITAPVVVVLEVPSAFARKTAAAAKQRVRARREGALFAEVSVVGNLHGLRGAGRFCASGDDTALVLGATIPNRRAFVVAVALVAGCEVRLARVSGRRRAWPRRDRSHVDRRSAARQGRQSDTQPATRAKPDHEGILSLSRAAGNGCR